MDEQHTNLPDLDELRESFALIDDWEERYRMIIELGTNLPPLADSERNDVNKVRGCVSQVWLVCDIDPGPPPRLHFRADSDAHLVRGLIAILLAAFSGKTPEQILAVDIDALFHELGLGEHLSINRRNGFFSMVERIRTMAQAANAAPS